jgi:hypothetical protein
MAHGMPAARACRGAHAKVLSHPFITFEEKNGRAAWVGTIHRHPAINNCARRIQESRWWQSRTEMKQSTAFLLRLRNTTLRDFNVT